jgi:hypothetical protein
VKSINKIVIRRANTQHAQIMVEGLVCTLRFDKFSRLRDYADELRTQAKWDAEKCQHES